MMNMKKVFALLLVLTLAFTALATVSFAEGTIKIGSIGPLTGGAAVYGTSAKQGAEIAIAEINALGGMQYEYNAQDDEHDAEKSVNAYNNLWDWGAQMIIGCVTTTPCIAVAAEANNDRMFMLTPSASSPSVTADNDVVYQVCFTDPAQGVLSAQYIAENKLASKIAVIYNNADAYSTGIYQAFAAEAEVQGLEIVSVTTFTDETSDFSVQVTEAKDKGAELVLLPIYYTPASMILKQAASMEFDCTFFGVDGMDGILTMEGFDKSLAEGVYMLTPFSAVADDERVANFVAAYEAAYNETPTQFAADGYDCVYVLAALIEMAGITPETPAEECCELLIAAIKEATCFGVTGEMVWNDDGDVVKSPLVVKIENGAYVGI